MEYKEPLTEFPDEPAKDDMVIKDDFLHTFDGKEWQAEKIGGYRTGRTYKTK